MKENELQEIRSLCPYPFEVLDGKIIACELVKLACQRFVDFLQREEMYFDLEDVKRKIRITESLKHFKGEYAGSNFILEPFQKFVYCAVYGIKWKKNKHRVTRTVMLSMGRKGGKALSIETLIPTPQGFKPMKDIMVGDNVYDENGRPTKVIATTDIMYNHKCYKLTFEDNTNIIADAGHQWYVKHNNETCTVLTEDIIQLQDVKIPVKGMIWKELTKIEEVESIPVKCIEVDSPNHLYCAGKEYIVTHNSSLISAMAINALFEEQSAQCIVAANSASQAGILFKMAQKYLKSLDPKNKYFRQYRDRIIFDKTSSEIRVVSADASRLDGLDCSFFVQDETAAAPSSEVWDVLEQSAGSRAQPLAVSCTTRGFNLSGFYKELEDSAIEVLKGIKQDDSLFTLIYTLDEGDDYEDPKVWKKCQPNLGVSVFPEFMEQQIIKGKNTPTQQYSIMTKVFNCWQSSSENWIQMDYIWKSMQKFDLEQFRNEFCYVSFDLASVNDLTCLGCMVPYGDKFYIKLKYYLPHDSIKGNPNEERLKRWAKDGYLTVTEGNVTDYDYVIRDIDSIQLITPIIKIAYDQWNSQSTAIELTAKGLPLQPYSQSLQSMNLPTKTLENMILSGKIVFDKNPITAWCFENAKTKYDSLDNVRIIKNSYTQKIDGAITSIMLMGGYLTSEHYDCTIIGGTC